jgi:hypothetical protein
MGSVYPPKPVLQTVGGREKIYLTEKIFSLLLS